MRKTKNKTIQIMIDNDLYLLMEKQISELGYSSTSEYGRNAIEEFIKENIEGGEYLTLGDVIQPFEEFAAVLKNIVTKVDRMESELNTLMYLDKVTEITRRLERIEKFLGIERDFSATP